MSDHGLEMKGESAPLRPPPPKTHAEVWAPIHGRYLVAQARPRNWSQVRYLMLCECQQLRFAEKARYNLARGNASISGWAIDFATALIRAMQNMLVEVQRVSETPEERVMRVTVTDLEANTVFSQEASVDRYTLKHMPPRHLRGPVAPHRHNAQGKPLYRHEPSEQELSAATNAIVSKLTRNLVLRHAPTWLLEDCMSELFKTLRGGQDRAIDQIHKKLTDSFSELGISPEDLNLYLGHSLGKSNPSELELLRSLFVALRNDDITWPDALEGRLALRQPAHPSNAAQEPKPSPAQPQETSPASVVAAPSSVPQGGSQSRYQSTGPDEDDPGSLAPARTPHGRSAANREVLRQLRQPKRGPVPT